MMTDDEKREKRNAYAREWRKKNPEKSRAITKKSITKYINENRTEWNEKCKNNMAVWRKKNPEKNSQKKHEDKINLSDWYVAQLIGISLKIASNDLLNAKREHVKTMRCIKQLETTLKTKEQQ